MWIKLPEKLIFNYLDDDQFMIVEEIKIEEELLRQTMQIEMRGTIFQIDRENATVQKQKSNIINFSLDVNVIYDESETFN